VNQSVTTVAVQQYLDKLAHIQGDAPAAPIVRELLARSVDRLHMLCVRQLRRSYPRLMKGPVNLRSEELLSAVVERLIKAMREVHPQTVRHFFALANQHLRWELNDLARRLDEQARAVELRESIADTAPGSGVAPGLDSEPGGLNMRRILDAIERLPEEEREVFNLVRLQGMTNPEAGRVVGVSERTVRRRLNRGLLLLNQTLGDLVRRLPTDSV
jgi:RNA polymerase sigma factor (sigma-70 family)